MKPSFAESVARLQRDQMPAANDLPELDRSVVKADILYRSNGHDRDMLKRIAIDEQSSVQAIMHEALNDWLIKRGRAPMA